MVCAFFRKLTVPLHFFLAQPTEGWHVRVACFGR